MDHCNCNILLHFYSALFFIFFFILHGTSSNFHPIANFYGKIYGDNIYFQKLEKLYGKQENERIWRRQVLSALGSSPPHCASKCGQCKPCKPVHIPVPPGSWVTTEYYPEAWRCKCGNNLYMPP